MDLKRYRESDSERERTGSLKQLLPHSGQSALDVGARDGHFSRILAERFSIVTALDLEKPAIDHPSIQCVKGDVTRLEFDDNSYDLVFCTEVLEHIPTRSLENACLELSRVSKHHLIIGVPYKQDIRVGRTTCYSCGGKNPPWGHVNTFDENQLQNLFPTFTADKISFTGQTDASTNLLSAFFMDLAGNPYGTYDQEEGCIHCGARLKRPPKRNLLKKIFTVIALGVTKIQKPFMKPRKCWIHVLFEKRTKQSAAIRHGR